jgi:hypothetical protein
MAASAFKIIEGDSLRDFSRFEVWRREEPRVRGRHTTELHFRIYKGGKQSSNALSS